jgi:hypothetical protein
MMNIPTAADDDYYDKASKIFAEVTNLAKLYDKVVDLPFEDKARVTMLSMGHMIFCLVNKKNQTIDRVALSNTDSAKGAVNFSVLPFKAIKIPLSNRDNYIGIAIRTKKVMATSDWYYTFTPVLTADQARMNQAGGAIGCSVIYPLLGVGDGAALVFSFYEPLNRIGEMQHHFMEKYSKVVAAELRKRQ